LIDAENESFVRNGSLHVLGREAIVSIERGDQDLLGFIDKDLLISKEEALYLLKVCVDYDYRFPIVFDRYHFAGAIIKTLEKLKASLYAIIGFVGRGQSR